MKIHRITFVALETLILSLPVLFIACFAFRLRGPGADAALSSVVYPFGIGCIGMCIWLLQYLEKEPLYSRIAVITFMAVFIFMVLCVPAVADALN